MILASVVNIIFYSNLLPVYFNIRAKIFSDNILVTAAKWIPSNMVATMDAVLNWTPLIILIGATLYAIVATILPSESDTWQGERYTRRY